MSTRLDADRVEVVGYVTEAFAGWAVVMDGTALILTQSRAEALRWRGALVDELGEVGR